MSEPKLPADGKGRWQQLELTYDADAAGKSCYEVFTGANAVSGLGSYVKPWSELSDITKEHWRAVAYAAVGHVETVQAKEARETAAKKAADAVQ